MADNTMESSTAEEGTQGEHSGKNHSGQASKGGARLQKTPADHGRRLARLLTTGALAAGVAALAFSPLSDRIRTLINTHLPEESAIADTEAEDLSPDSPDVFLNPDALPPEDASQTDSGNNLTDADEEYLITENAPQGGREEYFIADDREEFLIVTDAGTGKAVTDAAGTDVPATDSTGSYTYLLVEKRYAATLEELRDIRFSDMPDEQSVSDAISYSADREIFGGYPDGTFHPDALVTRGQALTLLHRAARLIDTQRTAVAAIDDADSPSGGGKFYRIYETVRGQIVEFFKAADDREFSENSQNTAQNTDLSGNTEAPDSDDDIAWAVQTGILSAGGDYRLNELVTRAQMAAFLYRLAASEQMDLSCTGDLSRRMDSGMVPEYALIPLSWAMEHNIYRTIVEDGLCPQIALSRGQTALLLTGFLSEALPDLLAQQITRNAQNPFPQSASREQHDRLQEDVSRIAEKYGATGVQVAVVEHGHVTDTYAYGWASVGKDVDWMDAYHPVRIASISKVIIGINTMRMAEDGLISLDEPIGSYWNLPFRNPNYPDIPVTLRTVLTHTSSISDGEPIASYVMKNLQRASGWRNVEPGNISSWEYSNYAFGILGMTLERAAGKTMDEIMGEYFLRAMDIDASFYAGDLKDTSRLTTLYYHDRSVGRSLSDQRANHAPASGTDGTKFPGGLTISAADLAKFMVLLANDGVYEGLRLLDESSVREMERSAGRTSGGFYQAQPLRYMTDAYGRGGIYYHTGSAYGVYNGFSYDPETGDGVIVLTTGASSVHDAHGNYAVCGDIFNSIYRAIAN